MIDRRQRLGQLMIAQLPALRRYALGLTGNRAAADDLVQDCIERALRRMDGLEDEGKMAAWLRSVLFNLFIDERRLLRSRSQAVTADVVDTIEDVRVQPDLRVEIVEVVRAAAALSVQHRQILLLIGVEGLSYREAAAELDLPIGTVMSRLARARDKLHEALTGVAASPGSVVAFKKA